MNEWADHVRSQARLIIDQIADLRRRMPSDEKTSAIENYYAMLEELFNCDLQLAQLRDTSHLLLRAEGEAFSHDPRVQLVSAIFTNVTTQVTDLTKAILGVREDGKVTPSSVDLALSGIARGSLYFGLNAQPPGKKVPLLGEADSLYDSTRRALNLIDDVAHTVEHDDDVVSLEEVSERIQDPGVRDAALLAVQRLAPSGRRGIESLSISGQNEKPALLTPDHRRAIRESLVKPVIHGEELTLTGYVREIDLDARRFDLRGIDDEQIRDVRCAYRTLANLRPRDLLGSYVRVQGLVERTADGIPRLVSVSDVSIRARATDEMYTIDETDTPLPLLKGPDDTE
jgi:hypothetical protein